MNCCRCCSLFSHFGLSLTLSFYCLSVSTLRFASPCSQHPFKQHIEIHILFFFFVCVLMFIILVSFGNMRVKYFNRVLDDRSALMFICYWKTEGRSSSCQTCIESIYCTRNMHIVQFVTHTIDQTQT